MLRPLALCILLFASQVLAQSLPVANSSASVLTRDSLSALTHGLSVTDVTLMGTVRRVAGADDERGAILAEAVGTGTSRINYSYNSGMRSESRKLVSGTAAIEQWSGPDGIKHQVVPHNTTPLSPWFFPALLLQTVENSRTTSVTDVGAEVRGGQSVEHLTIANQVPALHHPPVMLALLQKAARTELYIDSSTHLPVALTYNAHPDKSLGENIPVEIRFSDYRPANGVQVPFQIKKYFNRTLELDIQLTSAKLNSGLSASSLQLH
jgi:hypothetical protein